jgi:hypothetical protein
VTSTLRVARRAGGGSPARAGQLLGAVLVDTALLALAVAAVALAFASGDGELAILSLLLVAAVLGVQLTAWSRTGQTLGTWITGVRHVASSDGAPPGLSGLATTTWFADVRGGRDPADPETVPLAPPARPARAQGARSSGTTATLRSTSRALLVLDGRLGGAIGDGVVIGRNPVPSGSERAVPIADIGREISKLHLALRVDAAGRVWADDRKSTNGSTLVRADGSTVRLVPGTEQELRMGDVLRLGGHTVGVQFVTEVGHSTEAETT